jgi:hypothetical protein
VKRPLGSHAEPLEGELEDTWVGLLRPGFGRAHYRVEEPGHSRPAEIVLERNVPVGDTGESQAGRPEFPERRLRARKRSELERADEVLDELGRREQSPRSLEEDAGALGSEHGERLGVLPLVCAREVVRDLRLERAPGRRGVPLVPAPRKRAAERRDRVGQLDQRAERVDGDRVELASGRHPDAGRGRSLRAPRPPAGPPR